MIDLCAAFRSTKNDCPDCNKSVIGLVLIGATIALFFIVLFDLFWTDSLAYKREKLELERQIKFQVQLYIKRKALDDWNRYEELEWGELQKVKGGYCVRHKYVWYYLGIYGTRNDLFILNKKLRIVGVENYDMLNSLSNSMEFSIN